MRGQPCSHENSLKESKAPIVVVVTVVMVVSKPRPVVSPVVVMHRQSVMSEI